MPAKPERQEIKFQERHAAKSAGLGRGEMRKQLLTVILPLLLLVLAASAAETPAVKLSELQRVNVVRGTDDIRVEISSRGEMTPKLSTLDSPARGRRQSAIHGDSSPSVKLPARRLVRR